MYWMQGLLYGSVGFACGLIGQGIANFIMTAKRSAALFLFILCFVSAKRLLFILSFKCHSFIYSNFMLLEDHDATVLKVRGICLDNGVCENVVILWSYLDYLAYIPNSEKWRGTGIKKIFQYVNFILKYELDLLSIGVVNILWSFLLGWSFPQKKIL